MNKKYRGQYHRLRACILAAAPHASCARDCAYALAISLAATLPLAVLPVDAVQAQAGGSLLEEVVVVGSRNTTPRSVADSPVPVDVFTAEEFDHIGNAADITDNLRAVVPSYNATAPGGDQDTFVRAVSLRGLAADHTLVLIGGKRRHKN